MEIRSNDGRFGWGALFLAVPSLLLPSHYCNATNCLNRDVAVIASVATRQDVEHSIDPVVTRKIRYGEAP